MNGGPPTPRRHRAGGPNASVRGGPARGGDAGRDDASPGNRPPLRVLTTTLWEYPSQHYDRFEEDASGKRRLVSAMQGDREYAGATPSWVIWQLLMRYTREGDTVVDPMVGSGTTLDVCADLGRKGVGFDLSPRRQDVRAADARKLPLGDGSADFVFVDPPYSTHVRYSDEEACIGRLDAAGSDGGRAYFEAMRRVIEEMHRVLRARRYAAVYVSDSWRKRSPGDAGTGTGVFVPIGFELFAMLRERFKPVDIIAVARQNSKLGQGNRARAAEEGNWFDRGFNYLMVVKKE